MRLTINLIWFIYSFINFLYWIAPADCKHQQYFRIRPQTSVEVIEDATIVLQCAIGYQAGNVQWAKDGFVLGFDRSIPGAPRYTMVGNAQEGVHNLRIENVQMEDDGEYQCQVGPVGNIRAIRATSRLTVLLKPTSISINDYSNKSKVEVRQGEKIQLECKVRGGKPAPRIRWYRKSASSSRIENIYVEENPSMTTEVDQEDGQDVSVAHSKISMVLHPEDDESSYNCEALHSALTVPLTSLIVVSVAYPPGRPEITGFNEGETIRMGDTLTLVCKSRGGNPLAKIIWYKNNERIDFSYSTTDNRESVNSHTFTVTASDNNAIYRCEASSNMTNAPLIASVKLTVQFGPAKVKITGPNLAKSGDNVTMICETDPSNPPSEVSWVVDGRPVVTHSITKTHPNGGTITVTNVTVFIREEDINVKMFTCYGVNRALGETVHASKSLSILYAPNPPTIFGYSEDSPIKAGSLQKLTCESRGGYPLPDLTWFKNNKLITNGITVTTKGNIVSSELKIIAKDSDNEAIFKCEAQNSATNVPLEANTRLTVYFPPAKVNITIKPDKPKAGNRVKLICESDSSNPLSEITWWRDGIVLSSSYNNTIRSNFGGKATRNVLKFNASFKDDGSVFACQASNHILQQSVHDAITLRVLYKPEFLDPPSKELNLIESSSSLINLTAVANPSDINYNWYRSGPEMSSRFKPKGPLLNITNIDRNDAGVYKCEASNNIGSREVSFVINVHYPAEVVRTNGLVVVDENKDAHFECEVDANPSTKEMISWRRRKSRTFEGFESNQEDVVYEEMDLNRMQQTLEKNKSYLIIYNVSQPDSGAFDCIAFNGVGEKVTSTVNLVVKHKPRIVQSPNISKSASENGSTGKLICRSQGAPNVTFSWTHEGVPIFKSKATTVIINGRSEPKYSISSTRQLDLITYESMLLIQNVSSTDYGTYECIARNELGFDAVQIDFNHISSPDVPVAIRALNRTTSTVTLKWIPGFDGGLTQTFRIRYRKTAFDNEPYLYSDVFPFNTTRYTIKGLDQNEEYSFSVMAFNDLGKSDYSQDEIKVITLKDNPISETEKVIARVFSGKAGDFPRLIIIIVSVLGSLLLLLNLVLVICFVQKRRKKRLEEESDQASTTKTGAIEMYAPASGSGGSYNNGVTETSISGDDEENKSEGAYSGQTDFAMEILPQDSMTSAHQGNSTYLLEDILSPVNNYYHSSKYPSYVNPVGPDVTVNTYYIEDPQYAEALRKNSYNQRLDSLPTNPQMNGTYTQMPVESKTSSLIPPVPPLRSTNLATFLPIISEEPLQLANSQLGHLV